MRAGGQDRLERRLFHHRGLNRTLFRPRFTPVFSGWFHGRGFRSRRGFGNQPLGLRLLPFLGRGNFHRGSAGKFSRRQGNGFYLGGGCQRGLCGRLGDQSRCSDGRLSSSTPFLACFRCLLGRHLCRWLRGLLGCLALCAYFLDVHVLGDLDRGHIGPRGEPLPNRLRQTHRDGGHVVLQLDPLRTTFFDENLARNTKFLGQRVHSQRGSGHTALHEHIASPTPRTPSASRREGGQPTPQTPIIGSTSRANIATRPPPQITPAQTKRRPRNRAREYLFTSDTITYRALTSYATHPRCFFVRILAQQGFPEPSETKWETIY